MRTFYVSAPLSGLYMPTFVFWNLQYLGLRSPLLSSANSFPPCHLCLLCALDSEELPTMPSSRFKWPFWACCACFCFLCTWLSAWENWVKKDALAFSWEFRGAKVESEAQERDCSLCLLPQTAPRVPRGRTAYNHQQHNTTVQCSQDRVKTENVSSR